MKSKRNSNTENILMYGHYGSSNRGCEAIVRGTAALLDDSLFDIDLKLMSNDPKSDLQAMKSECPDVIEADRIHKGSFKDYLVWVIRKTKVFASMVPWVKFSENIKYIKWADTGMSIGGDNYCYKTIESLLYFNKQLKSYGKKNILWGCSIEPDDISGNIVLQANLRLFDAIFARESITYEALVNSEVNDNIYFCPDPAYAMEPQRVHLPSGWSNAGVVGINLSKMVMNVMDSKDIVMQSMIGLVRYIIDETDYNVVLIPHVIAKDNDDRDCLLALKEQFPFEDRVLMIDESYNAPQTKYLISNCEMFIGARTHSVIAAYSSCVPALAIGYSVKAKGLAKDLFGAWEEMVVEKGGIKESSDLIEPFRKLDAKKDDIRKHLQETVPVRIAQLQEVGGILLEIMSGANHE